MAFNPENLNKWGELAPSLQARFKELEDAIDNQYKDKGTQSDNVRISFGYSAPTKPVNNAEIWIDEKYRVLRVFAKDNWEFTRAAWYGGRKPHESTGGGLTPPPAYEPTEHQEIYFTYDSSASPTCHWSINEENDLADGSQMMSSIYVINGEKPISVTLEIDMSQVTNRTADLGYLLAVFGKSYDKNNPQDPEWINNQYGSVEWGKGVVWPLNQLQLDASGKLTAVITDANDIPSSAPSTGSTSTDLKLDTGYYCIFDIDCNNHALERIWPGDTEKTASNDLQGTTYFGNTAYPYCGKLAQGIHPNQVHDHTTYAAIQGKMTIKVTVTSTY